MVGIIDQHLNMQFFVEKAIQELVESGCAIRVPTFPVVCSPLPVVVTKT